MTNCKNLILQLFAIILILAINADSLGEQPPEIPSGFCASEYLRRKHAKEPEMMRDCNIYGICDYPQERDLWIHDPQSLVITNWYIGTIRLFFHILINDDGTNPAVSPQTIKNGIDSLHNHFEQLGLNFVYDWRYIYSTHFRNGIFSWEQWDTLTRLYTIDPEKQVNIFITYEENVGPSLYDSWSPYAWEPHILQPLGSIFLNSIWFEWFGDGNHTVLLHELGHHFGLWHTFHGTSPQYEGTILCGPCWESPGAENRDYKGDLCSDTEPGVFSYTCGPPGGSDPCSSLPWGDASWQNYMGYAWPPSCKNHFTPQQGARMRCWSYKRMPERISFARIEPDVYFGPAPLAVQFEGVTSFTPYSWDWDFDDGFSGSGEAPNHIYVEPGVYSTSVMLDAAEGTFDIKIARDIWVHADTLKIQNVTVESLEPFKVDISVDNSLPIDLIEIPLFWDGPANLTLDSASTVGLRTESAPLVDWISLLHFYKRGCLRICPVNSSLAMGPGTGAIVSLWFTPDPEVVSAETEIRIGPYGHNNTIFSTIRGSYNPGSLGGLVQIHRWICGDFNADELINILDIVYLIDYKYKGGPAPEPLKSADVNNDELVNILDIIYLINFKYKEGPEPVCP